MLRNRARTGLALTAALAALAVAPAWSAEPDLSGLQWHQPYTTLLDVDFQDTGFHARWEYFHCGCGDQLIRLEQSAPDGVITGELLIVDDKVLLGRGLVIQAPDLELMLQAPSLMVQLAFALLVRAAPEGPGSVLERERIDVTETLRDLELASGLSSGGFNAPWKVEGEVWPSAPGQRRFELTFTFSVPEEAPGAEEGGVIRISGGQDYTRDAFPYPDATTLDDWRVQWISRGEFQSSPAAEDFTLGALRAQALAESPENTESTGG
jgi:hypothetical protein